MIKRLRRKIILIAMFSIVLVISIIVGAINVVNYTRLIGDAKETISIIHNNEDMFKTDSLPPKPIDNKFGPEMKFQTRYFVITIDDSGNIVSSDFSHAARATASEAESYKRKALKGNKTFINSYYYKIIDNEIIFLDCEKELNTYEGFLLTSTMVSLGGCVIVFILIMILSKIAVRPFYLNEEKQKRFISDASHELKTPLTIINADIELIEMTNGESEWTKSILNQTSRLSNITRELTSLSKLDEIKYELSRIDVSEVLQNSIEDISILFGNDSISQEIEDNTYISANADLIKELFSILLDNAYKYAEGNVKVELAKSGKMVNIVFSNNAELEDGNYDYLFDRFYRLDSSRNSSKGGSGLGLSIAKEIVKVNKGNIKASVANNIFMITITFKQEQSEEKPVGENN